MKKGADRRCSAFRLFCRFVGKGVVDDLVKRGGGGKLARLGNHLLQQRERLLGHRRCVAESADLPIPLYGGGQQLCRGVGKLLFDRIGNFGGGVGPDPLLSLVYRAGEGGDEVAVFLDIALFRKICRVGDLPGGIADCATVGVIYAALGFLSAAIVGVPVARWFVRKGLNANKTGASITKEFLTGIMDEKSTATNGRETTHASTIDTLAFHVALVGIVYLITYAELSWIEAHIKPFFDQYKWLKGFGATLSMPMFFIHGLIVAWLLRTLLLKLGAGRLMDPVVQTRITGASVDYLLTATLMSIHIVVLKQYVIPIFLVAFSVTLFALALNLWFGRRTNYGPERVLCQFGCCCGSTATGLLLLRIIDPDFSTPATLELAFFNVGILVTCAPILYFFAPAFYTFTGMEILMIYGAITVIGIAAMFALKLVGQKQW